MSCTKQDYEAIATGLRHSIESLSSIIRKMPSRMAADSLINQRVGLMAAAEVCADHFAKNPRFDRARFLMACGVQS